MKNMKDHRQLSELVNMASPEAVLAEGQIILKLISQDLNLDLVTSAFHSTVSLYNGNRPGYHACNTEYHDLRHITDTFLTMARLIHGGVLEGNALTHRGMVLGLISALLHDTGYIQDESDLEGSGGKYTAQHVRRSMDFLERHALDYGLSGEDVRDCRDMILCTDLSMDIAKIEFSSKETKLLGKMLGAADLLAQMADRTYLCKLLFLYHEFREGKVGDYESEVDLLRKTVGFFDFIGHRLETSLGATHRFMISHFSSRWGIEADMYGEAIKNQKIYLEQILKMSNTDPREHLRRQGIVNRVRRKYGESRAKEKSR
jgi:hypothetical protein